MKLVTVNRAGKQFAGAELESDILVFSAAANAIQAAHELPLNLRGIVEGGDAMLDCARRVVDEARKGSIASRLREIGALLGRDKAKIDAPLPDTSFILSCGMNSREHVKEMNSNPPERPYGFSKSVAAIVGPEDAIILPKSNPNMVDWEGEFSLVIGRNCHNVKADEALDYVMGYTLVNDVTARDWSADVRSQTGIMGPILAWDRNLLGKQFPTFSPMGPNITTKDEIKDVRTANIVTRLNGQVMQNATNEDLIFDIGQLIEYYSQFYRFRPGDVITTGSPVGVGHGHKPPLYMKAGDRIEVSSDVIGTLSNPVISAS